MATEGRSTARRDALQAMESKIQARWAEARVFEQDAPEEGDTGAKFMCTFPYPYMNGRLHLGHAFSLSKAEFAAGYQMLKGKRVLFPFGFHCTGMPIQAAANRLKREVEEFGNPPDFSKAVEEEGGTKKLSKKMQAKQGATKHQWDIMKLSGLEDGEIGAFQEAEHWLEYFPPRGRDDLRGMGLRVDWRRSFITTDANPYYDAFVRWQFSLLHKLGKLQFGKRAVVFSPIDGQACADHDRASGEGVGPQEYTLIKLRVLELPAALASLEGREVFLVAATLRPETMYGQTNCFVLPEGEYGAFEMRDGSVFVCSERSARNMSYQGLTAEEGKVVKVADVTGQELLGTPLSAPLAQYERVFCLPLLTISMGKGTGVVTSVPSDAPDDWAALRDLQQKDKLRAKFGLTDEMVLPFEVVEIIEIPGLGRRAAVTLCEQLKVKSQNDKEKLAAAKERAYTEGFYKGVMLLGSQAGQRVQDAKTAVREELLAAGLAVTYQEPESLVVSRSGDECVVAFCDQWYLTYGEEEWRTIVEKHVTESGFTTYNSRSMNDFQFTLGWLHEWACSRSFGLGTKLPCDEQFVIESLSDSTIYMAYYTIAHLVQGNLDGSAPGALQAAPDAFTPAVFDYIFQQGPYPEGCAIPETGLAKARAEFEFWYPMDLRVSGKDLIKNHLTMSLYNHAAVWADRPGMWPRSFFTNGHVQVNAEKMSKSKGNFLTLRDAIAEWGADAMRFALADAGDGMDDANYEPNTANTAILRLTTEMDWQAEMVAALAAGDEATLRAGSADDAAALTFNDRVFAAEMAAAVAAADEAYANMRFKDALKHGFHAMQSARDEYRASCKRQGVPMLGALITRFMDAQTIVMAPLCPHWAEHVWGEVLGHAGFVVQAPWPELGEPDALTLRQGAYLRRVLHDLREVRFEKVPRRLGKDFVPTACHIFIGREYPAAQRAALDFLRTIATVENGAPTLPADTMKQLKTFVASSPDLKREMKNLLKFCASVVRIDFPELGMDALETTSPFDEVSLLEENVAILRSAVEMDNIRIFYIDDEAAPSLTGRKVTPIPGKPVADFE